MAKRKLTRRQSWRINKIQQEREARAAKKDAQADEQLSEGHLGPEQFGLIIAHYGKLIDVEPIEAQSSSEDLPSDHKASESENIKRCHFRANLGSLVTGDRVIWRDGNPNGVIVARQERLSELSRPDPYGDLKTVAANIDRIVIVIAPYPEVVANLIDRYLVAAETVGITPLLLLNKSDLIDDDNRTKLEQLVTTYTDLGYQTLKISTQSGEGLDELKHYLANYTSVFVGQSGVGKSSLVNGLLPDVAIKVGGLTEQTQQGTHTTTTARLYHFPGGGQLIDSPGIREFGLWHMSPEQLIEGFIEMRPFLGACKFRDCAHLQEPKCAINGALERGDISPSRMGSYRYILSTLDDNT